jgi:plastocyanin
MMQKPAGQRCGSPAARRSPIGRTRRTLGAAALGAAAVLIASGCGGGSATAPSADAPTITFASTGVSPVEVHIPVGGRVIFLNTDARPHAVSSDPITVHTDCPAINDVGTLNPGQTGTTSPLTVARTCGFHDHTNETDPKWKGRIVVE